jgi:hypothetical protein
MNPHRYIRDMVRPRLLVAALGAGVALATAVGIAGATTGPNGTRVPRVLVAKADGNQFTGRWSITQIEKRAKIAGGQVQIDYTLTKVPYLFGTFQLQTYDSAGRQTNVVANLYPFEYTGGKLRAKILSPGSERKLGSMTFDPPSGTTLTGTLTFQGGTYDVSYKQADPDAPITGSDGTAADAATPSAPAETTATPKTTGLAAADDGRYALEPSDVDAGASAGLYAPVVRAASALVADAPESGTLELKGTADATGTMTLRRPSATEVVYLTAFKRGGERRTATVHRDSADGPAVGTFAGTLVDGVLSGTLIVDDKTTTVSFQKPS